jgi:hypothetical protein
VGSTAGSSSVRELSPTLTSIVVLLCCAHLTIRNAVAQKQPAASQGPAVVWNAPAKAEAEDYVGVEICSACHQDQAQQFSKTVHAKAAPSTAKAVTGCESCHGPGKPHADAMMAAGGEAQKTAAARRLVYSFKGKPADNAARCLGCHSTSHDQSLFGRSQHKLRRI